MIKGEKKRKKSEVATSQVKYEQTMAESFPCSLHPARKEREEGTRQTRINNQNTNNLDIQDISSNSEENW